MHESTEIRARKFHFPWFLLPTYHQDAAYMKTICRHAFCYCFSSRQFFLKGRTNYRFCSAGLCRIKYGVAKPYKEGLEVKQQLLSPINKSLFKAKLGT